MGGSYSLIDHKGHTRTRTDPDGHPQLVYFGYVNCPGICPAALPLMADVADAIATRGQPLSLVMITVDPTRDTVDDIAPPLHAIHPAFVGLTGSQTALDEAYAAFNIDHALAYEDPDYGPVNSHGSLIYLMDGAGDVLTVLPPVLDAARATDITWKYIQPAAPRRQSP